MSIYNGTQKVNSSGIATIYVGNTKVYSNTPPIDWLCFEATNSGNISFTVNGTLTNLPVIYYKKNNGSWTRYTFGNTISMVNGDKCCFKGDNNHFSEGQYNYIRFITTCDVNASGNIMSLVDSTCQSVTIPNNYCFCKLFYSQSKLHSAPQLPATTLAGSCYDNMFSGCTSLTTSPALPATTLADRCYQQMFTNCTSLTTPPTYVGGNSISTYSCINMFDNCTSLTSAPQLPTTSLFTQCYAHMFHGCTSLTTAPALPATTLADSCYSSMFFGCTSLTTAPALPATTLAKSCYSNMFYGCTSLTTVPNLPATTLTDGCYYSMFSNCTSLRVYGSEYSGYKVWAIPQNGNPTGFTTQYSMFWNTIGSYKSTTTMSFTARQRFYTQNTPIPYKTYTITPTLTNCTASASNPTTIRSDQTVTLTFTPNSGYTLPSSVYVSYATGTWNQATGTLTIKNPYSTYDTISFSIYAQIKLDTPTNVTATGTEVTFDEVTNATTYEVYANGSKIGEAPGESVSSGMTVHYCGVYEAYGYTEVSVNGVSMGQIDYNHNVNKTQANTTFEDVQSVSYTVNDVTSMSADMIDKIKVYSSTGTVLTDWVSFSGGDLTSYLQDGCYVAFYFND